MANHKSAEKRARQNEQRRLRNQMRKTRMKSAIKAVEQAVAANTPGVADEKLQVAISIIDKTASKGVIHKNNAARKVSRLTRNVQRLAAAQNK